MDGIIINSIMIIFPMLVYFIYNCYRELRSDKYNFLVMDIAFVSSVYFCFKYGGELSLLFCNIPVVISYMNRRFFSSFVLTLVCFIFLYLEFDLSIILLLIKFFIYLGIYYVINKFSSINKRYMICLVVVSFFVSFEYFSVANESYFVGVSNLFVFMILFYIISTLMINLFNLGNNITNLYKSNYELEQEKKLRSSLFKITHEVKNPIAVCKGYLEMFDVNDKMKSLKYISIIKSEIDRSLMIMSDFMEFSKIKIEKDIMDINMLLEDIGEEFKIFVNNKNIDFKCKYMNDEVFIEGDYNRLKQVLINLIKNSIEAIEESGKIDIITHILKGYYYLEIIDNGCGMDVDELNKVKDMFFTTKKSGSGLGVSLSDEIIRGHGGFMEYSSKVGKGTKVVVKLPIVVL